MVTISPDIYNFDLYNDTVRTSKANECGSATLDGVKLRQPRGSPRNVECVWAMGLLSKQPAHRTVNSILLYVNRIQVAQLLELWFYKAARNLSRSNSGSTCYFRLQLCTGPYLSPDDALVGPSSAHTYLKLAFPIQMPSLSLIPPLTLPISSSLFTPL